MAKKEKQTKNYYYNGQLLRTSSNEYYYACVIYSKLSDKVKVLSMHNSLSAAHKKYNEWCKYYTDKSIVSYSVSMIREQIENGNFYITIIELQID